MINYFIVLLMFFPSMVKAEPWEEWFKASDYEVYKEVESRIEPGYMQTEIVSIRCPGTNDYINALNTRETGVCPNGMKITKWVDHILCEIEVVK